MLTSSAAASTSSRAGSLARSLARSMLTSPAAAARGLPHQRYHPIGGCLAGGLRRADRLSSEEAASGGTSRTLANRRYGEFCVSQSDLVVCATCRPLVWSSLARMHAQDADATSLRRSAGRGASVSGALTATQAADTPRPTRSPAIRAGRSSSSRLGVGSGGFTAQENVASLPNATMPESKIEHAKDVRVCSAEESGSCIAAKSVGGRADSKSPLAATAAELSLLRLVKASVFARLRATLPMLVSLTAGRKPSNTSALTVSNRFVESASLAAMSRAAQNIAAANARSRLAGSRRSAQSVRLRSRINWRHGFCLGAMTSGR